MRYSDFKVPHVFIFLFWIILFCSALSYIIPSGSFEREKRVINKIEQNMVVPGSYSEIPKHVSVKGVIIGENRSGYAAPNSMFSVLTSIPRGLAQSATLIFFIFILGAVFSLIVETKTIHAFLSELIRRFNNYPTVLFFLIYLTISTGSAFMGIYIELLPLIPILMLLGEQNGYDRMFGFALGVVPVYVGWSTATTNPFTVQIAQQIAELPIGSGMGLRFVIFGLGILIGFTYIMRYGYRVKKKKATLTETGQEGAEAPVREIEHEDLTKKHVAILIVLLIGYAIILGSVQFMGWGLVEMSAGFLAIGIAVIFISGWSGDKAMEIFSNGLKSMIIPALIVGVARGISVVMIDSQIMDSILYYFSNVLASQSKSVAVSGMLVFQSFLNFFIPSASGQALVSMPLMTPLSDLLGFSRQIAVLAYVFGDGFSNIVIPTNGILMAMLGIGKIAFEKWLKFVFPLFVILMGLALITIILSVYIGYE
ncbi:YfcC family protein [Aestuariivivens sediminicola]|uniref:YfcC family protein n=1 Tax=Aestuariivivens sediminicola TaxID=2913560 RepID=UPI001F5827CC|nr:AbgT family transporter [Aestuariivivens sediminicola]